MDPESIFPTPASRRVTSVWPAMGWALAFAWLLVVLRSLVYVLYEQAIFDSDDAIVGLMAKHLAEGRALPLFFYGQTYMLAVDAWVAAPFFLLAGASVTTLHVSVLAFTLVAVTLMIVGLIRSGGLLPLQASIATVFFTFAPPLTAASLIEADGNVGVFVYVPLLWLLRDRPLWFGGVLALGFLNREFTIYAVPAIAITELWRGSWRHAARWRQWLIAAVATLATWQGVQALKPYADLMGPGTQGQLIGGMAGSQIGNLINRVRFAPEEYPARAAAMLTEHLPRVLGLEEVDSPIARQGRNGLAWIVGPGLLLALARALWLAAKRGFEQAAFGWYLVIVGAISASGFVLTRPEGSVVDRYILLALLLPVGIVSVTLAAEVRRSWRAVVIGLVALWAMSSAVDHVQHARRYWPTPPRDEVRLLAAALIERGITIAEAGYWRAYKITFVAGERVIVASTDFVRIQEYRGRANQVGPTLPRIQEQPCEPGEAIGPWFLCRPAG